MKAISLWQPWATLVAHGSKQFETRGWDTKHRGPLAIHAALKWTQEQILHIAKTPAIHDALVKHGYDWSPLPRKKPVNMMPLGAIIAIVDLEKTMTSREFLSRSDLISSPDEVFFGDFSRGRWAWKLGNVRKLKEPIPWRGRQQMFTIPPDIAAECERRAGF